MARQYTNGWGEMVTEYERGDRVLFQSPEYPDLAPYEREIGDFNTTLRENGKPYVFFVEYGTAGSRGLSRCYPQSVITGLSESA